MSAVESSGRWRDTAEAVLLPVLALLGALLAFGVFVWLSGQSALEAWKLLFLGAFGDSFSWQNTLQRAAPLMLTALAVALPAQAGLTRADRLRNVAGAYAVDPLRCTRLRQRRLVQRLGAPRVMLGGAVLMLASVPKM